MSAALYVTASVSQSGKLGHSLSLRLPPPPQVDEHPLVRSKVLAQLKARWQAAKAAVMPQAGPQPVVPVAQAGVTAGCGDMRR